MPANNPDADAIFSADLDRTSTVPLYKQIATIIRSTILAGKLPHGTKLPPARALATQLNVNTVTTVHAYRALVAEGIARSQVGSGTFVCIHSKEEKTGDSTSFPLHHLKDVISDILDTEGTDAFAYDDAGGYPPLHRSLRAYLEATGFDIGQDETVIFSGAQQGLSVIIRALVRPGDWVLVERPTYPRILPVLHRAGARIECVDIETDGPDIAILERLFRTRPFRMAYVMPTYQTPTGICYADDRKQALHRLCAEHRVALVEDDAFSDIDYGPGREAPLRAICNAGTDVFYLKSFSHVMLPGFRLGVCLCPPKMTALLRETKEEADLFSSGFFQRVLNEFLEKGHFADRVRALCRTEGQRFRNILSETQRILGNSSITWRPARGGSSLWFELPTNTEPARFHATCIQQGIRVTPGREHAVDSTLNQHFSLNHTGLSVDEWREILLKLCCI